MRGLRVSNAVLVAALVAWVASFVPIYGWLFRSPAVYAMETATYGLVTSTLLAYAITAAMVAPVLWIGRQTPALVGLRAAGLGRAAAVLVFALAALQVSLLVAALVAGDGVHAGNALLASPGATVGRGVAQLFATTLVEEVFFRGFVLRQLVMRVRRPMVAIVASALLFAISHVPNRLWLGLPPLDWIPDALGLFGGGVFLGWLYLRTENLFLCVAMHFLWNDPVALVAVPFPAQWMLAVPGSVLVAWILRTSSVQSATADGDRAGDGDRGGARGG